MLTQWLGAILSTCLLLFVSLIFPVGEDSRQLLASAQEEIRAHRSAFGFSRLLRRLLGVVMNDPDQRANWADYALMIQAVLEDLRTEKPKCSDFQQLEFEVAERQLEMALLVLPVHPPSGPGPRPSLDSLGATWRQLVDCPSHDARSLFMALCSAAFSLAVDEPSRDQVLDCFVSRKAFKSSNVHAWVALLQVLLGVRTLCK